MAMLHLRLLCIGSCALMCSCFGWSTQVINTSDASAANTPGPPPIEPRELHIAGGSISAMIGGGGLTTTDAPRDARFAAGLDGTFQFSTGPIAWYGRTVGLAVTQNDTVGLIGMGRASFLVGHCVKVAEDTPCLLIHGFEGGGSAWFNQGAVQPLVEAGYGFAGLFGIHTSLGFKLDPFGALGGHLNFSGRLGGEAFDHKRAHVALDIEFLVPYNHDGEARSIHTFLLTTSIGFGGG